MLFNEKCDGLLTSNFYKNIYNNNDKKNNTVLTKIELKVQKFIILDLLRLFSLSKGIYRLANLINTHVNAKRSSLLIILRKLSTILRDHSTTLSYLKTISCSRETILRELKMMSRDLNLFFASLKRFHATLK